MKHCILFLLLALLASTVASPAQPISELKITDCDCSSCRFTQIGYGYVYVSFNGAKVSCSSDALVGSDRLVYGWYHDCGISGSSGKFEVSTVSGNDICGITYDRVYLHSCSGTPCSGIAIG